MSWLFLGLELSEEHTRNGKYEANCFIWKDAEIVARITHSWTSHINARQVKAAQVGSMVSSIKSLDATAIRSISSI